MLRTPATCAAPAGPVLHWEACRRVVAVLASVVVFLVSSRTLAEEPTPQYPPEIKPQNSDQEKTDPKAAKKDQKSKDGSIDLSTLDRDNPEAMAKAIRDKQKAMMDERTKMLAKQSKSKEAKQVKELEQKGLLLQKRPETKPEERLITPGNAKDQNAKAQKGLMWTRKERPEKNDDETATDTSTSTDANVNTKPVTGSMLERLNVTMAAKRLQQKGDVEEPYEPAPATLVELDIEKPLVPAGHVEPKVRSVDLKAEPPKPKVPENIEELREEAERRFLQGLDARDTVIRDWSFRFGTTYRRREAIPSMVRELKSEGWLSALAAVGLGQIGVAQDDVVSALRNGLSSKEATVRQTCAHSLGQLTATSTVRDLAKLTRTEKNFQVRAACCGALGLIGDRGAIEPLRQVLKAEDETQLVKAEAALSLARLGDRSGAQYLEACFRHPAPNMQFLGLSGLVFLRGPNLPSCLITALSARYEEVWLLAVRTLPTLGPGMVQDALREALGANLPQIRHRAGLALGLMGDRQALPYIQQALLEGNIAERQMAAELIGLLGHRESIPILIERLREPSSAVRVASALALVRLDAKEALPALIEASQGPKSSVELALSRGGPLETQELMFLLGCIRQLKGEEGSREFTSLPDPKSTRWPEYEKELERYQLDVLRGYRLVDVMGSTNKPVAAILRDPQGREQTYRAEEAVASGFRIHEMHLSAPGAEAAQDPAFVVLQRGITRVVLFSDGRIEVKEVDLKKYKGTKGELNKQDP